MYEISVKTQFSAAHHLKGYAGTCSAFHGHNWDVEVYVRGATLDETGILIDFRVLRTGVQEILSDLDHRDLNTVPAFTDTNPSSENIARYLYEALSTRLNAPGHRISRVVVHETPGSAAAYWEEADAGEPRHD